MTRLSLLTAPSLTARHSRVCPDEDAAAPSAPAASTHPRRARFFLATAVAGTLALSGIGCGSESDDAPPPPPATAADTVTGDNAPSGGSPGEGAAGDTTADVANVGNAPGNTVSAGASAADIVPNSDSPPTDSSTPDIMPLAIGQWSHYRFVDADGESRMELVQKVIGQEDDAWWFEMSIRGLEEMADNPGGPDMGNFRVLLHLPDQHTPEGSEIRAIIAGAPGGRVMRLEGRMLDMGRGMYDRFTDGFYRSWGDGPEEDVSVAAGTFPGTIRHDASANSWAGSHGGQDGQVWHHSAVPISGMVRAQWPDGTMELMGFGLTGAQSVFGPEADNAPPFDPLGALGGNGGQLMEMIQGMAEQQQRAAEGGEPAAANGAADAAEQQRQAREMLNKLRGGRLGNLLDQATME